VIDPTGTTEYATVSTSGRSAAEAESVSWRGQDFRVLRHPVVHAALAEFCSDFEAGTLGFFDAVLPACDRMIDVGAYVGLMSLYSAARVQNVFAFEASPINFDLLARNIALNGAVGDRIKLFPCGIGDRNDRVPLYAKAYADSGSSIFRTVERGRIIDGSPTATVELRHAETALREIGVTPRTLLKIDIEGAEYLVVPTLAGLLMEVRPFLHLSFHPFNLVAGPDEYRNAVLRLRRGLEMAEALACYRFMYFHVQGAWYCIEPSERMVFLREYLLRAKPVARIATPQYGFIDAVGFSDAMLPALAGVGEATPPAGG